MTSKTTTTNTKLHLVKQGGPFALVQGSPIPTPAADEVVVKLKAIGLNPVDWKQMLLGVMIPSYPTILGNDGAGIIEAVGNDVKDIKVGDEVASHHLSTNDRAAAFQEFAAVKATEVALKPASWSFTDAASLPVGFITAVASLHEGLEIALPFLKGGRSESEGFKPTSILVLGGSSSVGATAIALMRLALPSTTTILTTCSMPHHARVVDVLGATRAFDPKSPDVLDAIRSASPNGAGVDAILDVVNAVALQPSLLDLLAGSDKLFVEVFTGRNLDVAALPKGITHRIVGSANIAAKPYGKNVYPALADLLAAGKFELPTKVDVVGQGLEAVEPGLKRLMGGVSGTKLVVAL